MTPPPGPPPDPSEPDPSEPDPAGMDPAELAEFERALARAVDAHDGSALDGALGELGWVDALAVDERAAVATLFELQGRANRVSGALDHVLAHGLGIEPGAGAVLWPAVGTVDPPGTLAHGRAGLAGMGSAALASSGHVLAVLHSPDGPVLADVVPANLTRRTVHGVDPSLGLVEVRGEAIEVGSTEQAPGWTDAVALAQLALGHELVGSARAMLELARQHALERVQFGRPIAMFQAVRHRLADALVAVETADAALDAAWRVRTPQTASIAKALAGRGARAASRHAQQVLAGIGFTTEHPLHLHVRRVLVLDELFGAAHTLTADLGAELLATRQPPPLLPL